jgi:hypothetical protein
MTVHTNGTIRIQFGTKLERLTILTVTPFIDISVLYIILIYTLNKQNSFLLLPTNLMLIDSNTILTST